MNPFEEKVTQAKLAINSTQQNGKDRSSDKSVNRSKKNDRRNWAYSNSNAKELNRLGSWLSYSPMSQKEVQQNSTKQIGKSNFGKLHENNQNSAFNVDAIVKKMASKILNIYSQNIKNYDEHFEYNNRDSSLKLKNQSTVKLKALEATQCQTIKQFHNYLPTEIYKIVTYEKYIFLMDRQGNLKCMNIDNFETVKDFGSFVLKSEDFYDENGIVRNIEKLVTFVAGWLFFIGTDNGDLLC